MNVDLMRRIFFNYLWQRLSIKSQSDWQMVGKFTHNYFARKAYH